MEEIFKRTSIYNFLINLTIVPPSIPLHTQRIKYQAKTEQKNGAIRGYIPTNPTGLCRIHESNLNVQL